MADGGGRDWAGVALEKPDAVNHRAHRIFKLGNEPKHMGRSGTM